MMYVNDPFLLFKMHTRFICFSVIVIFCVFKFDILGTIFFFVFPFNFS